MKKIFFNYLLIFLLLPILGNAEDRLRAFPGAEGFGAYTTGGRGGRVIYVTNVKNTGTGSLREALSTSGTDPITIVFRCGGVIKLTGPLDISRPNITIAGQTALGNGICIAQQGIKFTGDNIIIRHIRFRAGDELGNDPVLTFGNAKNAIFDHCSFSWSTEENVNITDADSVTLQWCINSESIFNSSHPKGSRGYAAQWGGQRATYHHNILAHHNSRMPRQNGNTSLDFQLTWDYRNNVHYNWASSGAFYGGGVEQPNGFSHSNLVNNYYVPGPATTSNKNSQYFCAPSGGRPAVTGDGNEYVYGYGLWWLSGNVMKDNDAKTNDNFSGLSAGSTHWAKHQAPSEFVIPEPFVVTTTSADIAYDEVLGGAGVTLPYRDSIDMRIVKEISTQTATYGGTRYPSGTSDFSASKGKGSGIIDTHNDLRPDGVKTSEFDAWDSYYVSVIPLANDETKYKREQIIVYRNPTTGQTFRKTLINDTIFISKRFDTDGDGMPDKWELANGLDPSNADDRNNIDPVSGYTMLEVYLNSIDGSEDVYNGDDGDDGDGEPTGVTKDNIQPHLRIYPNPAASYFNIETILEPKIVEIYTLNGTRVASFSANGQRTFSISPLQKGIYFVKVTFENGKSVTQRMIK